MKLKTFALAFAFAGGINTSSATDGTINFIGTISSAGCTVNSVAGVGSTTGSIDFGQINSTTLANVGDSTVSTPFSIELTDCATASTPEITFEGDAVTTSGYESLFESGAADGAGVGIRITDASSGTAYTPGTGATNVGFSDLSSGSTTSATGNFNAYLVAYESGAKSGQVDANVTFTIDYSVE